MTSMIERVARAVRRDYRTRNGMAADDHRPSRREMLDARAAIAAMREPTEGMVTEGERHTDSYYSEDGDLLRGWQAMIDKALEDE